MKQTELKEYFSEKLLENNIRINDSEMSKFFEYKNLLVSWNKKFNLTAITDDRQIVLKHFVDSLTVLKYIDDGKNIIDVGTGAGFPGIPLKIVKEIKLTLLDSLSKRINFLTDVSDKLGLSAVRFVHERAEDAGSNSLYREKFDFAVSRAVAPLAVLSEYCLPFVRRNGIFIAMKGSGCEEEINESKHALKTLGGKIEDVNSFSLNGNEDQRTIIIIRKLETTPKKYPRRAGIPSKMPLK